MKIRADISLVKRGLAKSRNVAQRMIDEKMVKVGETFILKAKDMIDEEDQIEIVGKIAYVGRGGEKLAHAIEKFREFGLKIENKTVIDIGSSTGGFTDCLLQNKAKHVYAIDVGKDQFDKELVKNQNVSLFESTDIRNFDFKKLIKDKLDLATIDVSFISLLKILPKVKDMEVKETIALFKPQFEVGKENLNRNGIVKSEEIGKEVLEQRKKDIASMGFKILAETESPIKGGDGNTEYLLYLLNSDLGYLNL